MAGSQIDRNPRSVAALQSASPSEKKSGSGEKLTLPTAPTRPSVLDKDNPVMQWLASEEEQHDPKLQKMSREASDNLNSLMGKVIGNLRNDTRPVGEKIMDVYRTMKEEGFKLKAFGSADTYGDSLTYCLAKKQLDCDTSTALVIGAAKALGWPQVDAVIMPDHAFVRWGNKNFDQGVSLPDKAYLDQYGVHPEAFRVEGTRGVKAMASFAQGILNASKGQIQTAIADYTRAIDQFPKHAGAYSNRGVVNAEQGNDEEAIADFSKAIEIVPDNPATYSNRGSSRARQGLTKEALSDFSKVIELDPRHASAYNNRGVLYASENLPAKALADYSKAIEINPGYASAYFNRGVLYATQGLNKEALADYSKAIALAPSVAASYYNRALVYTALGQHKEAASDYAQAVKLDPSN